MYRNVFIVFVALAPFFLAVRSDDTLKCYMCTSVTDEDCGDDITKSHKLEPTECTISKMTKWQRSIQQNKILHPIFSIFAVDDPQHDQSQLKNMACAKVDAKIPGEDKLVTIRSCQTAPAENVDPCTSIEGKLQGGMKFCELCQEDGCNGSIAVSPRITHAIFSVLGSLAFAFVLYRDA
ncbi:hypothetical protein KPH14_003948 [Odynerus spinipes]|uniref:Protein sleepless n=1 Tax=Odynerus spinipes TaxID=1348599 RepID=A0AAD9VUU5_9HYME|nr:hypothetical protein KPH14_003948 [Odynerus spinipes]